MIKKVLLFILVASFLVHCNSQSKSEYQLEVEKEMAKGVRNDSLFLGYHFGMTQKEFYEHSWKLNKEELIRNGTGAEILQTVNDLKAPADKIFYPEFKDEKIVEMPVTYSYHGWSPWNRHLWADSLKLDLKRYLEDKYNISFKVIENPSSGQKVFYQISANKEIRISEVDQSKVRVRYIDLTKIQ
ncbi:MAG: hypothetical protein GVY20_01720 [Bacteroidetes bacterium]|jgi:hypothetical protein|nr:hypothetical protein [Bacteroidota bacterium]